MRQGGTACCKMRVLQQNQLACILVNRQLPGFCAACSLRQMCSEHILFIEGECLRRKAAGCSSGAGDERNAAVFLEHGQQGRRTLTKTKNPGVRCIVVIAGSKEHFLRNREQNPTQTAADFAVGDFAGLESYAEIVPVGKGKAVRFELVGKLFSDLSIRPKGTRSGSEQSIVQWTG